MKVISLAHVHLRVNNVEQARDLFQDLTGATFKPVRESQELGVRSTSSHLGLVLLQPTSPDSQAGKMIEVKNQGIASISLRVENIEEAIAELEAKGIKLIRKIEIGQVKEAWFESTRTLGVQIELSEFPGDAALRVSK